jgi:hypothetical protein
VITRARSVGNSSIGSDEDFVDACDAGITIVTGSMSGIAKFLVLHTVQAIVDKAEETRRVQNIFGASGHKRVRGGVRFSNLGDVELTFGLHHNAKLHSS